LLTGYKVMGAKFVNYQVKSNSQTDVVNAVQNLSLGKCYISPPLGGWITVYDENSDNFSNPNLYDDIVNLARLLSNNLSTVVFAFIVFGGITFIYFAFDNGNLVDEFYDDPENGYTFGFSEFDTQVALRFQGCPEKIISYFTPEVTIQQITEILEAAKRSEVDYLGEDVLWHLAPLMGIDEYRATQGFTYFEDELSYPEEDRDIKDAEQFILVDCSQHRR
jgi:hypothetical protein